MTKKRKHYRLLRMREGDADLMAAKGQWLSAWLDDQVPGCVVEQVFHADGAFWFLISK